MKPLATLFIFLLSFSAQAQLTIYSADQNSGIDQTVDCWGNSLTAGAGGTSYPTQLSWLFPNRLINNYGIGGQKIDQIAARQGGSPLSLTLTGNAFSGVTSVTLTGISTQLLSTAADQVTRTLSGVVLGIPCLLTRTATVSTEVYTLQPVQSQSTAIPAGSLFYPDVAFNAKNHINLFELGRNNVPSLSLLPATLDACISQMARPRRFLVIGVLNAVSETVGTANYTAIAAANAILAQKYGDNFVPMTPPTVAEQAALNYTPSAQALIEMAAGTIPTEMRADDVHLNTLGYALKTLRIGAKFGQFSW
ncbi:MAG: SGNH/GDSL hydrolase family protein [Cytophagaceae bacterium]|nr:MAG: SGNH/GDSL hydrolase family protein [Cytophagaceae bacterium]